MGILRFAPVLLVLTPQCAEAGAWARGEGQTFVALSYKLEGDPETLGTPDFETSGYTSLLVERGLGPRLTFGLDAGIDDSGDATAIAYVSRTVGPDDGPNRFALHAGGGASRHDGMSEALAYLGASWGRGIETRWGNGWAAADPMLYYRTQSGDVIVKADVTVGVSPTDKAKVFIQLQAGQYPDADAYLRVVPSMAYNIGKGRDLEIGTPLGLVGDDGIGLKLGAWLSF